MITVFHDPTVGLLGGSYWERKHLLPFEIYSEFQITKDLAQAVIIPVITMYIEDQCKWLKKNFNKNQHWLLIMVHTHVAEGSDNPHHYRELIDSYVDAVPSHRILLAHTNLTPHSHISYNYIWDICKLYYTDYNKLNLSDRLWSGSASANQYKLTDIPSSKNLEKIWVVPNRYPLSDISEERFVWRNKLDKAIDHTTSVYGNPDNKQFIPAEGLDLDHHMGFIPIANQIYNTTLISAYTESITQTSQTRCITEKTYNPLIKGHFILPYGYSGLIQDIRSMGFLLPKWINYDYDRQCHDELRWEQYISEYHRINSIPKDKLEKVYRKNKNILDYNRQLFFKKPYSGLPNSIAQYLGISS